MKSLLLVFVVVLCQQATFQKQEINSPDLENLSFTGHVNNIFNKNVEQEVGTNPRPHPGLTPDNNNTGVYLRSALSTKVIPFVYILVITIGVPSNVAILCTLLKKIRKVSSSILYSSLAVSDLLLLLSLVLKAHYHLHGNQWKFGEIACRVVTACFYGNLYCSAQTLACISVTRYLAVVHPFVYRSMPQKRITALICFANWAVFAAAMVPELLIQQTYKITTEDLVTCHDVLPLDMASHRFLLPYNIAMTVIGLLAPLVATVWSYNRIIVALNRSHLDWAKYIKVSFLVLFIFLVCFTPAGVLHMVHYVKLTLHHVDIFYAWFNVAVCLCCLHACLDPFLFLLMSHSTSQYFGMKKKALNTSDTV
ncbi:proteinase-activated receptor 3-like [Synchiropus splendidus]|uniref:proteinase-activated receptor 3-like n=1 Tax=Synchiropus splendidus TaxID=270530 RepID=UPI00237EABBA|nr:proteinase-activated receptor 3-like [Synchiropus splendidus]